MMFPSKKLWVALTLMESLVSAATPMLIAYRVVDAGLAKMYKDAGNTLVTDTKSSSSDQLGPGVYTSPIAGDWFPTDGKYVCAIYAKDKDAWNALNKAWMPEKVTADFQDPAQGEAGCEPTWWMIANAPLYRLNYLLKRGFSGFSVDSTVLFSLIDNGLTTAGVQIPRTKLQMLIPQGLLSSTLVSCDKFVSTAGNAGADSFASINKGEIDWSSWPGVAGVVQVREPET